MLFYIQPENLAGLTNDERYWLGKLISVFESHWSGNIEKNKYYEGKVSLQSVNLGIALPDGMKGLEIGC